MYKYQKKFNNYPSKALFHPFLLGNSQKSCTFANQKTNIL